MPQNSPFTMYSSVFFFIIIFKIVLSLLLPNSRTFHHLPQKKPVPISSHCLSLLPHSLWQPLIQFLHLWLGLLCCPPALASIGNSCLQQRLLWCWLNGGISKPYTWKEKLWWPIQGIKLYLLLSCLPWTVLLSTDIYRLSQVKASRSMIQYMVPAVVGHPCYLG